MHHGGKEEATYKGDGVAWFDVFMVFNLKRTQILKYLSNKGSVLN